MIFFLTYFGMCYNKTVEYNSYSSGILLHSFGFKQNGRFSIEVHIKSNTSLQLFLLTSKEYSKIGKIAGYISEKHICSNSISISHLNYSMDYPSKDYYWNGIIESRDIYYPIFINCLSNHTYYTIFLKFKNPD